MIRFEDILFHAEEVMKLIMECIGAPMDQSFRYFLNASKPHGYPADFVTALAKYGREVGREGGLSPEDVSYLRTALDPELLEAFHYPFLSEDVIEAMSES
jgi:hypothetical protein